MRLIDAEKLAEVLNRYFAAPHVQLRNSDISVGLRMGINTCLTFLNNANTIEAEPIVRCKECIYWKSGENECDKWEHCILHNIGIDPDSFCSNGERKEGADNG